MDKPKQFCGRLVEDIRAFVIAERKKEEERLAAQKRAEEERRIAEQKRAEEQRLAEQRRAEEARRRAEEEARRKAAAPYGYNAYGVPYASKDWADLDKSYNEYLEAYQKYLLYCQRYGVDAIIPEKEFAKNDMVRALRHCKILAQKMGEKTLYDQFSLMMTQCLDLIDPYRVHYTDYDAKGRNYRSTRW